MAYHSVAEFSGLGALSLGSCSLPKFRSKLSLSSAFPDLKGPIPRRLFWFSPLAFSLKPLKVTSQSHWDGRPYSSP